MNDQHVLLLIEDNPGDADLVQVYLQGGDWRVKWAKSLREAGELLAACVFDAILLDLHLPDCEGLPLLQLVRTQAQSTPIVVLTGGDDTAGLGLAGLREGAQDYLIKENTDGPLLQRSLRYALERQRLQQALMTSEQQYRDMFERGLGLVCTHDLDGNLITVNPAAAEASGFAINEIVGRNLAEFMSGKAREALPGYLQRLATTGEAEAVLPIRARSGEKRYWLCRSRRLHYPGRASEVVGYGIDVTDRRRAEQALADSERQYRELFDRSFGLIATHTINGVILSINPAGAAALGYGPAELIGTSMFDLVPEHIRPRVLEAIAALPETGSGEGLIPLRSHSGETRTFMYRNSWVVESRTPYVLAHALDITERIRAEEVLTHQAMHDPLTGCANRALFFDRLNGAIARARRARARGDTANLVGLIYLDLDNFKPVNDRFGHDAGDFVLRESAARMRTRLREADTAARLGGDEFCILAGELRSIDDAIALANEILAAIREPLAWNREELRIGGSLGIALFPDHGDEAETLLACADRAMYAAKSEGKDQVRVATTSGG